MDLNSLLFGEEEWQFLLQTFVRTTIMFLVILIALRFLGKRGVQQLSVFELGVIIGLGSAAGDPMFYKDVGILPSVIVFVVVVSMYRLVTYLISKSDTFETFVEGRPAYILQKGVLLEKFEDQPLGHDELFAVLRQKQIFHLGQIETVIIESDGQLSVFFFPDDKVVEGLPILPHLLNDCSETITEPGTYSCCKCGTTAKSDALAPYICPRCKHNKCVKALHGKRIT